MGGNKMQKKFFAMKIWMSCLCLLILFTPVNCSHAEEASQPIWNNDSLATAPVITRITHDSFQPLNESLNTHSALNSETFTSSPGLNISRTRVASDRKLTMSLDGRFMTYKSDDPYLVPNDTNGFADIFMFDQMTNKTKRVSVNSQGQQTNGPSEHHSISDDGRFITFSSEATNLVPNDTNNKSDIFIYDSQTGETTRISNGVNGQQSNGESLYPPISADGHLIAFSSEANNLVFNDTNGKSDIFLYDRINKTTKRISISSEGLQSNGDSSYPSISPNGRYIVFTSTASNLVPNCNNSVSNVFLYDSETNKIVLVSIGLDGQQSDGTSYNYHPAVTDDGRHVAFASQATNLVDNDTNNFFDIFVRDFQTKTTERVSVDKDGNQANGQSLHATISDTGRYVAFHSFANNLVQNDTNNVEDVFIYDLQTKNIVRASQDANGNQGDKGSYRASISGNGKFVGFTSIANNLTTEDTNNRANVFLFNVPVGFAQKVL